MMEQKIDISTGVLLSGKPLKIATHSRYVIHIRKSSINVLEIEDVIFRHNSAVFLPDGEPGGNPDPAQPAATGLSVLKTVLLYACYNKNKKLLLAGHTDSTGSDTVNFELSKQRAYSTLYLLTGERQKWAELCNKRNVNEDLQHILKWAGYDPGPIDGVIGPVTRAAIRAFQKDSGLDDDGVFGPLTWGAVFDRYQAALCSMLADPIGQEVLAHRTAINWAYGPTEVAGCGELFPREFIGQDEVKSQKNRRVEALFFDQGELPPDVCKKRTCTRDECPIYGMGLFTRKHIKPDEIGVFRIRLLDYDGSPLSNETVEFIHSDRVQPENTTDGDGLFTSRLPPSVTSAKLTIRKTGESFLLIIDEPQALESTGGVQERLRNLGYYGGEIDNVKNDLTMNAAIDFRLFRDPDYQISGTVIDDEFRKDLKRYHGC